MKVTILVHKEFGNLEREKTKAMNELAMSQLSTMPGPQQTTS